jgi:hypothetical protein
MGKRAAQDLDLLFHSVLSRFFTIRARQPAAGGVTLAQMRVLWTLEREGSAALGQVAEFAKRRHDRWRDILRNLSSGEVGRLASSLAVVDRLLEKSREA